MEPPRQRIFFLQAFAASQASSSSSSTSTSTRSTSIEPLRQSIFFLLQAFAASLPEYVVTVSCPLSCFFLFLLHASHHSQTKSVSCCNQNTGKHTSTYKLTQDSVQAKYWKAWLLLDLCSFGGEQWEVLNERESLVASLTFAERFTDQLELNHCQV